MNFYFIHKCLFLIFVIHVTSVISLYEDQIGKFDWRQQYVGMVKLIHFDQTGGSRRIVVATQDNVLASLQPRTGQIVWRQVMEKGNLGVIDNLCYWDDELITVTGGGQMIRGWEPISGFQTWEYALLVAPVENPARRLIKLLPSEESLLVVDIYPASHIQVNLFHYKTEMLNSTYKVSAPWLSTKTSCEFSGNKHLVCVTNGLQVLNLVQGGQFQFLNLDNVVSGVRNELKLIPLYDDSRSLIAIKHGAKHVTVLELTNEKLIKTLIDLNEAGLATVTNVDNQLILFAASQNNKQVSITAHSLDGSKVNEDYNFETQLPEHHGSLSDIFVYTFNKKDGGSGSRAVAVTEDHAIILLQQSGKAVWTREESLTGILAVEMVDLPLSDTQAEFEKEFGTRAGSAASHFIQRLVSQLTHMQKVILAVMGVLKGEDQISKARETKQYLTRDEFNLHKIIIAATSSGKLFGLDNLSGNIIWQRLVPQLAPFNSLEQQKLTLLQQRTSGHEPLPAQCIVIGKHKLTGEGLILSFNPITGEPAENPVALGYKIQQLSLLPEMDENFVRPVVILDSKNHIHVYPQSAQPLLANIAKSVFMFTANPSTGLLAGYSLADSTSQKPEAELVWSMHIPVTSQVIQQVVTKNPNEHVHSQGRVMGDRSVLYKYLNPNLAVIITEGKEGPQKANLFVYLIDTVSGITVYSMVHKRCRGPVQVVHSENWAVYSYFSEKSRRTEMTVIELYEGKTQSNTTAFSSLAPPPTPLVERQSYIFPSHVDTMAVTITEKGLTNKHVLVAMPSGGILELPKFFLDPRRPLIPTYESREEGIPPYVPELPIPSESILNYNRSVLHVRSFYTASSGLESTCLVLAYGIDLLYTRVAPSKTFDLLKDDFDHLLISAVLFALIAASYICKKLASKKALRQAWK